MLDHRKTWRFKETLNTRSLFRQAVSEDHGRWPGKGAEAPRPRPRTVPLGGLWTRSAQEASANKRGGTARDGAGARPGRAAPIPSPCAERHVRPRTNTQAPSRGGSPAARPSVTSATGQGGLLGSSGHGGCLLFSVQCLDRPIAGSNSNARPGVLSSVQYLY